MKDLKISKKKPSYPVSDKLNEYLKEYKRYNPDVDDQDCKDMQENLEKLVSEKERLFPDEKRRIMSAPSKANISKPANPARVTANHRHGTEPYVC